MKAKLKIGSLALALALAVIVAAALLQFVRRKAHQVARQSPAVDLVAVLPRTLPGWQAEDLPLGPNEGVVTAVRETLRFDSVVFRQYRRGEEEFSVYAAYWRPGKMPVQLVASHTPDRCWTENGWRCEAMRFDMLERFGSLLMQPAQWRLFHAPDGQKQYVLYWQLVNGRAYDFGRRFSRVPSYWRWWRDAAEQMFLGGSEQYFIRISSGVPFDQLRADPGFETVMNALGRLGLAQPAAR